MRFQGIPIPTSPAPTPREYLWLFLPVVFSINCPDRDAALTEDVLMKVYMSHPVPEV